MTSVNDIAAYFEAKIPSEFKMDFDNVGLLVGLGGAEVSRVLLSLDITDEVINEAATLSAQLIISHHPVFFSLKRVSDDDINSAKVVKLLQNGISALCLHTNFDSVDGGVNDALASALGITVEGRLEEQLSSGGIPYGIGRFGQLKAPIPMADFLPFVKAVLKTSCIRYYDAKRPVKRIALCGGSGGDYVEKAAELCCDTLLTADVKYHQLLLAKELGINLLDADHFCTENVALPVLEELLLSGFPHIETHISRVHGQTAEFF